MNQPSPNPPCPQCKSDRTTKNGSTQAGTQRYRCKTCNKSFTPKRSPGRPTIGDRPLTKAEIQQRYYNSLNAEEKKHYNKSRRKPEQG